MRTFLVIALALISYQSSAGERGISVLPYVLDKSELDKSISTEEAVFKFTFKGFWDTSESRSVHYSVDGDEAKVKLMDNKYLELKTTPGKHRFQFYVSSKYYEVTIEELIIKPQYRDEYSINLQDAEHLIICSKPVIYLYPEKLTAVHVIMDIKGNVPFIYPAFNNGPVFKLQDESRENINNHSPRKLVEKNANGWIVKAHPDGRIEIEDKKYNYLFWESHQEHYLSNEDLKTGFIVPSSNAISFLEDKLTEAGLNSKEQADFITFWGPKLASNPQNFVRFEFNEECDKYAEMFVEPQPDRIYRIYIIWAPVDESFKLEQEQKIIPMNREGFTVLEWGGIEHSINEKRFL